MLTALYNYKYIEESINDQYLDFIAYILVTDFLLITIITDVFEERYMK